MKPILFLLVIAALAGCAPRAMNDASDHAKFQPYSQGGAVGED
jgi:hypothetical protein